MDTGRFELKNDAYKTYEKIVDTFGTEEDNVIIVCISHDGYILHKEDMEDILALEEKLNESVDIHDIQSIVDYIMAGMHILSELKSLPSNISVSFDTAIFSNLNKMRDAVENYEFIKATRNESAMNDSYRVFILLPSYINSSMGVALGGEFGYTYILNESKYRDSVYNATNILLEEMEIYENLSRSVDNGEGSYFGVKLPEEHNLTFVNESIKQVEFNITQAQSIMEHYNTTYIEWYSYNVSFSMALSLLYSGQDSPALLIYKALKDVVERNIDRYYLMRSNWTSYAENLGMFLRNQTTTEEIINETNKMKSISFGTLRDYLDNYSSKLIHYLNSSVSWEEIRIWTLWTENISQNLIDYYSYSAQKDVDVLPLINGTISDVENRRGYENASRLVNIGKENTGDILHRIVYRYAEKMIYQKVLKILTNLKSILLRDETGEVKQYAWELLSFSFSNETSTFNHTPLKEALYSYRKWIYTEFYPNFTAILWDYLSLEPFEFNVTAEKNITYDLTYTRADMRRDIQNMHQEDIDQGIMQIKGFHNGSVESLIQNYTLGLNATRYNLTVIYQDLRYLIEKYSTYGGDRAVQMVDYFTEFKVNVSDALKMVNNSENQTYSLRMIEDYFSSRDTYFNTLLSKDQLSTIFIIGILDWHYEMTIHNIVKAHKGKVEYHALSSQVLIKQIEETATHDMRTFLPLSIMLLIILLYITYRTVRHVVLSLAAVLIVLVWMFGFATFIGWDFDPILLAVPIMIVGIGVDDGIYVTLRYMEERKNKSRERATMVTIASIGGALILTTLTSMAGFLSNTLSNMEDIRRFGVLAAAGLFFSFVVMNTFLPAANMLLDRVKHKRETSLKWTQIGARVALKNPYVIVVVALIVSSAGIMALGHINTEFNLKDLAPEDSEIIVYYHFYQNNFNASVELSYIYFEGNITSPEVIKAMAEVENNVKDDTTVVHHYSVISPWSIMKYHAELRRGQYGYNESYIKLFKESDVDGDGVPDGNISKLYKMLEPEISHVVKADKGIFIIHTDSEEGKRVNTLIDELNEDAKPLEKYGKVKIAGDAIVDKASVDELNENQLRSLGLSVTSAIIMLIILFRITKRSITLGIIAAIPIILVVTWSWLLMYILGISLNVMTNTIASLCVGLGVDYGIHITHRYVEESYRYYSLKEAILRATGYIGRGMLGASATTITAIGILTLSTIPPLSNFALILSVSILFSFISAIMVLPSLLIIWSNYRRKHGYDRVHKEVIEALKRGDWEVLCRYHISMDYCYLYVKQLISLGKIKEARDVVERLKEEGVNLESLLKSTNDFNPPFE